MYLECCLDGAWSAFGLVLLSEGLLQAFLTSHLQDIPLKKLGHLRILHDASLHEVGVNDVAHFLLCDYLCYG